MPCPPEMIEAIRAAGHEPKLTPAGEIDWWALDLDSTDEDIPHSGPGCRICGAVWCEACWERGHGFFAEIEPCEGRKP